MNWLLSLFVLGNLALPAHPTLDIYWIDVEGGAATLIVTPAGESVLIDAGENVEGGEQPDRDALRVYRVATKVAHLKQIDHMVVTHFHSDHMGGIVKLSQLIPIKHYYDHGTADVAVEPYTNNKLLPLYKQITQGRSKVLQPGDRVPLRRDSNAPPLEIRCLASGGRFGPSSPGSSPNPVCSRQDSRPEDPSDNARSLVLLLKYGTFTFFDGGDLTWQNEGRLVCPTNRAGTVVLMQIDHHGLDQSNNPVLIESLQPRVVVVNNGPKKGAEINTMRTLRSVSSIETVWQVHRNLAPGFELNADAQFIANESAQCKGEFIKASAHPDGTFSVQIGPSGPPKVYGPKPAARRFSPPAAPGRCV